MLLSLLAELKSSISFRMARAYCTGLLMSKEVVPQETSTAISTENTMRKKLSS